MLLSFHVQSPLEETSIYNLECKEIEQYIDVLNHYVVSGYKLLSACLIDDDGIQTELPLEAFDGNPVGEYIRKLQMEYQQVLDL
jgi:hypothetical protein